MAIKKEIEIEVSSNAENAGKGFEKLKGSVDKVSTSFGNLVKASGIIFVITKAFEFLKDAFSKNEKVANNFQIAATAIFNIFQKVTSAIVDAFSATSESTSGFEKLGKVLSGTLGVALNVIGIAFNSIKLAILEVQRIWENSIFGGKDLAKLAELDKTISETTEKIKGNAKGIADNSKKVVTNFVGAVGEVATLADNVVTNVSKTIDKIDLKSELSLAKNIVNNKKSNEILKAQSDGRLADLDREAEKLRQIRDDESISIKDRIKANDDLKKKNEELRKETEKNFNLQIETAKADLAANKNQENRVKLIDIESAKKAALAGIEGKVSEQKANVNSLTRESIELSTIESKTKLDSAKIIRDANAGIIDDEKKRYDVTKENLLKTFLDEEERLQKVIDTSTKGTKAYADAIAAKELLEANFRANNINLDNTEAQRQKALKDRTLSEKASLIDAEVAQLDAKNQLTIGKELELYNSKREIERQRLVDSKATADALLKFDEDSVTGRILLAEKEQKAKQDAYKNIGDAIGALSDIVGKQTAAGKALGIAQALINTYVGVSEVIKSKAVLPEPLNTITKIASIATTLATGFKTVQALTSVQVPGGGGGSAGGANISSATPVINTATTQTPQTQLALSIANAQKEPVQAYVVSSSMTTQQALDRNIRNNSTIG